MRSRIYIITANDIEPGSIWDARETYNNMLARRRTREAMRMIFYYVSKMRLQYELKIFRIYITKKQEFEGNIADFALYIYTHIFIHTWIYALYI